MRLSDARFLVAAATLAVTGPLALRAFVRLQIASVVEPSLSQLTGVPVRIGDLGVDPSGVLVLEDVAVANLLTASRVEAAVSISTLLSQTWSPDAITVVRPRIRFGVDREGRSSAVALLEKVARRRKLGTEREPGAAAPLTRHRPRVIVRGGALSISLPAGTLEARDVEVRPTPTGARIVAGSARVSQNSPLGRVRGHFTRIGIDVTAEKSITLSRLVAVGGDIAVTNAPVASDVVILLAQPNKLYARGIMHEQGAPRSFAIEGDIAARTVAVNGRGLPIFWLKPVVAGFADVSAATVDVDATLSVGTHGALTGEVKVHDAMITTATVSTLPVPASASWHGRIGLGPDAIDLNGTAVMGAIQLGVAGTLGLPFAAATSDVEIRVHPVACLDALESLPVPLRAPLAGLTVDGTFAGHIRTQFDPTASGQTVRAELGGLDGCRALVDSPAALPASIAQGHQHRFPNGNAVQFAEGSGVALLRSLPAHVVGAFIAAEDARFFLHRGFDVGQIERSMEINLRERRLLRGGSTISQQLAKNEWLSRERTLERKLAEVVLAWRLERTVSKQEILGHYLEIIELGPNIFGVAAAARFWFAKPVQQLSAGEAALLAAMTAEPASMTQRLRGAGKLDARSAERRGVVLRGMKRAGFISEAIVARALAEPVRFHAAAITPP